jgi:small-conductance mechanosensitive channel
VLQGSTSNSRRGIFVPNSQIINSALINFTREGEFPPAFTVGIEEDRA